MMQLELHGLQIKVFVYPNGQETRKAMKKQLSQSKKLAEVFDKWLDSTGESPRKFYL